MEPLVIGNTLHRLPPDQWCHTVQPDETLATIAAIYGINVEQIYKVAWNQLTGTPVETLLLSPGYHLRIPLQPATPTGNLASSTTGSPSFLHWMLNQPVNTSPFTVLAVGGPFAEQKELLQRLSERALRPLNQPGAVPVNWPYGSGVFRWPLAGWLTQGYRYDHRAIDIAAPTGSPVTAADRGVVVRAGWNQQGYGLFVIIDHNIDYVTLYAHLSEVVVAEGQVVAQGDLIGKVGSTGNSTGPHLHFEIRDFGRLTNPLELLSR
jgi:murein DD-endopeptidase MepM/ murein hydrolase activator NlpD